MTQTHSAQPFDDFRRELTSAKFEEFQDRPDAAVEDASAFDEMRTYLLGITVLNRHGTLLSPAGG